jgi:hypothetical protein
MNLKTYHTDIGLGETNHATTYFSSLIANADLYGLTDRFYGGNELQYGSLFSCALHPWTFGDIIGWDRHEGELALFTYASLACASFGCSSRVSWQVKVGEGCVTKECAGYCL